MRRFWWIVFVLTLFSLAAAQSARQSTLVIGGDWTDLVSLDPGVSYEFSGTLIVDNIYETLVRFEGTDLSTIKPGVASSWDMQKQADGSTKIIFHLGDHTFSTGRPVTAKDVVYSINRVLQLNTPSRFLLSDVAHLTTDSVKAIDDKTVEMDLPADANPNIVMNVLTFNVAAVVDSTEAKAHAQNGDFGSGWLKDHSAGSGPYVLERWDLNSQVVLTANKYATRQGPIKRVIFRYMKEPSAQKIALDSGDIDVAYNFTPENFTAAAGNPKYKTIKGDTFVLEYLGMASNADSPFADPRVRQAVNYAIDRDSIITNLLSGLARKAETIIPMGLADASDAMPYSYDPEKAKALLAAAGKENGITAEFLVPNGSCDGGVSCADLAAKIQSDLAAVGIKVNIRQTTAAEVLKIYRAQQSQLVLESWSPDYPDPAGNATPLSSYGAKSLAWRNQWKNAEATKLAQQGVVETDPAKRAAIYKQLTDLVAQQGPFAILYQPDWPIVTGADVSGFVRNAQGDVDLTKVSKQ